MNDNHQAQTEVLLRRALAPIRQEIEDVPQAIVRGAMRRGHRRRQLRRATVAFVPLVAAVAVAVTVVTIRFSTTSSDGAPTDATRTGVWRPAAESPLSPRSNPTMVQVGGEVVVLGGSDAAPCPPNASCAFNEKGVLDDGAVYEPARDVWRRIAPAPVGLTDISAAASGTAVYVLTGPTSSSGRQQFWEYSLTRDRWTRLAAPPQPMDLLVSAGADHLIAYVVAHEKTWTADQSYDIASRTWSPLPRDPLAPSEDRNLGATDSGHLVLIAVDRPAKPGDPLYGSWRAAVWDAGTGRWKEVPTPRIVDSEPKWWWVADRVVNPSTESVNQGQGLVGTGGILEPDKGTWQPVPPLPDNAISPYPWLQAAGAGRVFVRGQLLDVRSGTWTQASRPPALFPTQDAATIIIDDRVIVFGGAVGADTKPILTNDTWVLRLPVTTAAESFTSYVGQRWVLTAVDHGDEHVVVPEGSKAWIEFDPSGRFSMSDTANGASGKFTLTADGFRVSEQATTLVGVATEGPKAVAARAMQGIIGLGDAKGTATEEPEIRAHVVDGKLIMNVGSDVLAFQRGSVN